jgi:DNA-binding NarL/FixJ family response regulator
METKRSTRVSGGARTYLLKDMHHDELVNAIRAVHQGQRFIPPAIANRLAERMPRSELTARELDVLKLIVKGMSNKEIASTLRITEGTVKIHVNNMLGKLGVSDRPKLQPLPFSAASSISNRRSISKVIEEPRPLV